MLIGEYNHTIDSKGRVIVPARFRDDLGDIFYITKGLDGCLFIMSSAKWTALRQKLSEMPMSKARALQRFFFAGACEAEPDKQGRILIPQSLRDYAALDKDVTIIGTADRAEMWSTERWEKVNAELTDESIAEVMDELDF